MGNTNLRADHGLEIQYLKTDELKEYDNNSRTHNENQIRQIAASIKEFGFTNPILVDEQNQIIAGHGRLYAAQLMQLANVPTISLTGLSETQKRAYVIADNKLALNAGWNDELLSIEIEALLFEGFDLDIIGFDEIPEFAATPDYGVLDEEELSDELNSLQAGVRKAIQIEFEPEHYGEAQEVISWWRQQNAYIGMMLIDFFKRERSKHEA
jgi:hypothetical protein